MNTPEGSPSLLEVAQQEIAGPDAKEKFDYLLARGCLPVTLAAMDELVRGPSDTRRDELLDFIQTYGPGSEGAADTEYYARDRGWLLSGLADLLRKQGNYVVVQNLLFGSGEPIYPAIESGRVREFDEMQTLLDRMEHGGRERASWHKAIKDTLTKGIDTLTDGAVIPIISIPLMSGKGMGGHSVLIIDIDSDRVRYFDSDVDLKKRYEINDMLVPDIRRVEDESRLFYEQPTQEFVERMTGELLHVFPKL